MSMVLITGRTDGKKTKTVTTPVETQPTFQNKQTKNTKQWVLKDVTHIVKFFLYIQSCSFVFHSDYAILSTSYVIMFDLPIENLFIVIQQGKKNDKNITASSSKF